VVPGSGRGRKYREVQLGCPWIYPDPHPDYHLDYRRHPAHSQPVPEIIHKVIKNNILFLIDIPVFHLNGEQRYVLGAFPFIDLISSVKGNF